ncbi:D-Ala-D-Ala carboxypeptidase family metallohydrolase [Eubacterium sp. 1001713B170207_170306_E7]|uniref:YcbK family protein n=1 Tax=Eubacterium sp. 1001713B170207_170306_E7 TaxID=2787097 RepID=UPI001896CF90|nr:D-Ala-D-Ala carboxypeptidase family metallohydrolase [Eubacterium sp. 1001713B170207_170306_E7]
MERLKRPLAVGLVLVCAAVSLVFLGSLAAKSPQNTQIPEQPAIRPTAPEEPEKPPEPDFSTPQGEAGVPPDSAGTETPAVMATPHFAMSEYRCDCPGYCDGWPCEMAPQLLEKLEALRCSFGQPVIITSGVRCEARNEEVGGVSWSFHKRGCAADLYCPGVAVGDLAAGAEDCGLNVLPYYHSGYIHVEI